MKPTFKILSVCLVILVLFTSCSKKKKNVEQGEILQLEIHSSDKNQIAEQPQRWHVTNKRICVLFGYGFNDAAVYNSILDELASRYGLAENGGLIYPLIYPESFKHGTKGYVNDFLLELEDSDLELCGVITLGAPDRTHNTLAKFQDFWKQDVPYPVIALYPQDDVLGIEATCDIVVDKAQAVDMTGAMLEESNDSIDVKDVESVICDVLDYVLCAPSAFAIDSNLQKHVQQMFKNRKIHRYLDPETGLQSVNHFVLY